MSEFTDFSSFQSANSKIGLIRKGLPKTEIMNLKVEKNPGDVAS